MTEPSGPLPIAATLWHTVQRIMAAFDKQLAEHGGTRQVWHILRLVNSEAPANQRELAGRLEITDATLTHHLNAMEERGIITRTRDPENRRVQRIEVTPAGQKLFDELKGVAMAFDRRLRRAIGGAEAVADLEQTLARLREALPEVPPSPPFE